MRRFPCALVASLALAVPVRADIAPAGGEFQVNTYTTGLQSGYRQTVCRGDAGDFVVAFRGSDANNGGILARRYASNGVAQGTEFQVNVYTTNNQEFAAVACAPSGDFVVVWRSFNQDGDNYAAVGRRFASSGTPIGTEFRANTYTTGGQSLPRVAVAATGAFLVLWDSTGQDGDAGGIYAQRYASDGAPVGTEFRVNTYTTSGQGSPAAAFTADGNVLVVWDSFGQDGAAQGIYGQRYSSAGAPLGTEFRVNTYTSSSEDEADIARTADGGFVVAWQDYGRDGAQDGIFAQRLASDGSLAGTDFRLNAYTTADQTHVSLAAEGTGGFVAAWSSSSQDGHFSGIFARRFDASGVPRGTEFRVNTYTTDSQTAPTVATDRDGDFVVSWMSNYQDGDLRGIFAQRFADPCGDGTVGAGEACDDGSRVDGPCCSATCQNVTAGTACDSDGVDCTADACNDAGACGHTAADNACPACRRCDATAGCVAAARTDCRRPTRARAASLQLTNKSPDAKDKLAFVWQRGAATAVGDFGALPASPDYTLCLFDRTGGAERLVLDATIPAGGGWKKKGAKGFRYRSRAGTPDGITAAALQRGAAGKAKATVAGKGASLGFPAFPLTPPVHAQLQAGGNDGVCFAADFAAPKKNTSSLFKAKGE